MASSNIGGENRDLVLNPDHGSQPPYGGRPAAIRAALGANIDSRRRGPEVAFWPITLFARSFCSTCPRSRLRPNVSEF